MTHASVALPVNFYARADSDGESQTIPIPAKLDACLARLADADKQSDAYRRGSREAEDWRDGLSEYQ